METYDLGLGKMLRERLERILKRHGINDEIREKILFEMHGPVDLDG